MASAAARLLFLSGHRVIVLERERPLAVRRLVSFAAAVFEGEATVEGVRSVRVERRDLASLDPGPVVRVAIDPAGETLAALAPAAVVDGRMAKRNLGTRPSDAPCVVALGPGFRAPEDAHAVVETQRGPNLGRVITLGSAEADSGEPAAVQGVTEKRVLRALATGVFESRARIGDIVVEGDVVGEIAGVPITARTSGLLRGLIADGVPVDAGVKLGDVDPRGRAVDPARISDKARAVAAGVLEAVALGLRVALVFAAGGLALPAFAGKPAPEPSLPQEHAHPSGAFTFHTPAGWTSKMLPDRTDIFEASGDGMRVRFYFKPQEIGLDALHVTCMEMRLKPPMDSNPQVKYEYDFVGGALGSRKVLDSAFEVHYDAPIDGSNDWRQRNVSIVGEGQSLCAISHAPRALWKKSAPLRLTLDAVVKSVSFRSIAR